MSRRMRRATAVAAAAFALTGIGVAPVAAATSDSIAVTQYAQHNSFYCGPAVAYAGIRAMKGVVNSKYQPTLSLTQEHLAGSSYLKTDQNGATNWFLPDGTSSGYNNYMPLGLNRWLGGTPYYQEKLPDDDGARLRSIVIGDITAGKVVFAATVEYANGGHYNFHPNRDLYHWVGIRGYSNSGNTIMMWDPAANSGTSGFQNALPTFNVILGTAQFYIVVNEMQATQRADRGRGVVW